MKRILLLIGIVAFISSCELEPRETPKRNWGTLVRQVNLDMAERVGVIEIIRYLDSLKNSVNDEDKYRILEDFFDGCIVRFDKKNACANIKMQDSYYNNQNSVVVNYIENSKGEISEYVVNSNGERYYNVRKTAENKYSVEKMLKETYYGIINIELKNEDECLYVLSHGGKDLCFTDYNETRHQYAIEKPIVVYSLSIKNGNIVKNYPALAISDGSLTAVFNINKHDYIATFSYFNSSLKVVIPEYLNKIYHFRNEDYWY